MKEKKTYGVLAEFDSPGALVRAAEKIRDAGYSRWDCHTPFPIHGLDQAMGTRMTILPLIVFFGGLTGCAGGMLLQWWANAYHWPWIVSGKPFFSLPAQIPVIFECTVLLSAFTAFFGMWIFNRLPQVWHPLFEKDRFLKTTDDGFFVSIEAGDAHFDRARTEELLRASGASSIEICEYETSPAMRRLPKGIMAFIIISGLLALVPFAFIFKARESKSEQPHFHIIPNMDFQPKFKAQDQGVGLPPIFFGGRADRIAPKGTVAKNELRTDDFLYRGLATIHENTDPQNPGAAATKVEWATDFPPQIEISEETMHRGQRQFGIYCRPCHGDLGDGQGMINLRAQKIGASATGWNPPTNLADDVVIRQPNGQLFNTITHGIRTMPGYGSQLTPEDRWAVVLYVRALQRSRKSLPADLPETVRERLR
jgi:mono/diheme cytochrome c family protein